MNRKLLVLGLLVGILQSGLIFAKYTAGSIGTSTRFMGVHNIKAPKDSDHKDFGYSMSLLEFFPQERKGLLGYSSYIQIRFATPFAKCQRIDTFMNEFRWGFLFGGSSRLINTIKEDTGKGWGLFLNGGMTVDLASIERYVDMNIEDINTPVNLGAELSLRAVYNFTKYSAITFGIDIGYIMSFSYFNKLESITSGFEFPDINDVRFDHALVYGLTVGFLF
ncbi:MAG: hypothetical protein KFW21_05295 [Spirochaetota bacterium]|nr:hypothetical protein [Spirochaetota bacterium]